MAKINLVNILFPAMMQILSFLLFFRYFVSNSCFKLCTYDFNAI